MENGQNKSYFYQFHFNVYFFAAQFSFDDFNNKKTNFYRITELFCCFFQSIECDVVSVMINEKKNIKRTANKISAKNHNFCKMKLLNTNLNVWICMRRTAAT